MGNFFWQGMWHPLLVPAHTLVLVALGLLAGQQGGRVLRLSCVAYAGAVTLGLVLTRLLAVGNGELTLLLLALVCGGLAALQWHLPVGLVVVLALVAGVVIGLDSAVTLIPGLRGGRVYAQWLGTGLGSVLVLVLSGVIGFYLHKLWQGIAVRVLGAWVTAGTIMVLTLLLSKLFKVIP